MAILKQKLHTNFINVGVHPSRGSSMFEDWFILLNVCLQSSEA